MQFNVTQIKKVHIRKNKLSRQVRPCHIIHHMPILHHRPMILYLAIYRVPKTIEGALIP